MIKKIVILLLLPVLAFCQSENNIDKIVAKIDNYYILKSEIENLHTRALQENQTLDKCKALESIAIQKLMVAKAEIDSVVVEEDAIRGQLDARMSEMIRMYGSEKNIVQQFNKSIETLKTELKSQVKEQLTVQKVQANITEKLSITPNEVKVFFTKIPIDSLPIIPTEVVLAQIVKLAEVTKLQKSELVNKLRELKLKIENGVNFGELAKEYSEDQGSKVYGGDLGWAKRGSMVPPFEAAAMALDSGKLSDVVESEFGYHLIETLEKRGQEYHARHILLRPDYSRLDVSKPKVFLDSIKHLIDLDSIKFEKAVKLYSEDKQTQDAGGVMLDMESGSRKLPLDASMEPNLYFKIDPMKVGEVSEPMNYRTPDGKTGMRIIKMLAKHEAHRANLKDDYEKLRMYALNSKQNIAIEKWFKNAISEVYISIDPEYQTCRLFEQ